MRKSLTPAPRNRGFRNVDNMHMLSYNKIDSIEYNVKMLSGKINVT